LTGSAPLRFVASTARDFSRDYRSSRQSEVTVQRSWRFVLLVGCLWAIFVTLIYGLLNAPMLTPERFWSTVNPDQAMMIGFMSKKYGLATYLHDFVINSDPHVVKLYNPANQWLLYEMHLLLSESIPAAFFCLLVLFVFLYVACMFAITYGFTGSVVVAGFISLISTQWTPLAFAADAWGIGVIPTSRAAYFVLPLVPIVVFLSIRTYNCDRWSCIFLTYCLVGAVAILHPVTAYHLFATLCIVGLCVEFALNGNPFSGFFVRLLGFCVGAFPTLVSIAENRLYGLGPEMATGNRSGEILEAMKAVNPSYAIHLMPEALGQLPVSEIAKPAFVLALILFIATCTYCAARILVLRIKGREISPRTVKFLWIISYSSMIPILVTETVVSRPVLIPIVLCVLAGNALRTLADKPSYVENVLLTILCVSLLFSVVGSWAVNFALDQVDYPVRMFEQIRGIRIAWMIYLLYLALTLGCFWKVRRYRIGSIVLAGSYLLIFLWFYGGTWRAYHGALSQAASDRYDLCVWAKTRSNDRAAFAMMTGDPWKQAAEGIRFKACSGRSMLYSYDAINLMFTNAPQLIAARNRMKAIRSVRSSELSLADFMTEYGGDYVIVNRDEMKPNAYVAYENQTFAVIKK